MAKHTSPWPRVLQRSSNVMVSKMVHSQNKKCNYETQPYCKVTSFGRFITSVTPHLFISVISPLTHILFIHSVLFSGFGALLGMEVVIKVPVNTMSWLHTPDLSPCPANHRPDDFFPSHIHTYTHTAAAARLLLEQKRALSDQVQLLYKRLRDIFLIFEQLISCKSCLISLHLSWDLQVLGPSLIHMPNTYLSKALTHGA